MQSQCLSKLKFCGGNRNPRSKLKVMIIAIINFFRVHHAAQEDKSPTSTLESKDKKCGVSLLDLPDLALEYILECLSPSELCKVSTVCTFLRAKCRSDYLWETHMKRKWGKVISDIGYNHWQKLKNRVNSSTSLPDDSIMARYISLETGEFWFPAQIYFQQNAGLMLYWYDALLSYDSKTDNFISRRPHDGWKIIIRDITWDIVRPPVADVLPYSIYISDSLNDLRPGDHVEVQWRGCQTVPYDWWYAVIGHLESCEGHSTHCQCCYTDMLIVEFNQYPRNSNWRVAALNRKNHSEQGNLVDGFYGGIRKLQNEEEIARWKKEMKKNNENYSFYGAWEFWD